MHKDDIKHDPKKHSHQKQKLQKLGKESMEELERQEGQKHPGGG